MTAAAVDAYIGAIPDPAKRAALQDLRACVSPKLLASGPRSLARATAQVHFTATAYNLKRSLNLQPA
jgi:hypothetical protein